MYIDPKQTPQEAQAEVLAMALTAYWSKHSLNPPQKKQQFIDL